MPDRTLELPKKHGWKCSPGYCIFVLDRGAVRFDIPQGWIVKFGETSVKIHDREPPGDDCALEVSCFRHPPVDWAGLPLRQLLNASVPGEEGDIPANREIVEARRADLELAWTERRYVDPGEKRDAVSRVLIGRGTGVHCLITFDFWADQAARFDPAWDEIVRSLVLACYVADPARGPVIQ